MQDVWASWEGEEDDRAGLVDGERDLGYILGEEWGGVGFLD